MSSTSGNSGSNGSLSSNSTNSTTATNGFTSPALSDLWTALTLHGAIALVFIGLFVVLRPRVPRTYSPLSLIRGSAAAASARLLASDHETLSLVRSVSHDGVAVIGFAKHAACLFGVLTVLAWVALVPIHATGGNGLTGLSSITLGNVSDTNLLWTHLAILVLVTGATVYAAFKMAKMSTALRQHHLATLTKTTVLSAHTVMVRDVPDHLREAQKLHDIFDRIRPGAVAAVVVPKVVSKSAVKLGVKHTKARNAIEGACATYIRAVVKKYEIPDAGFVDDVRAPPPVRKTYPGDWLVSSNTNAAAPAADGQSEVTVTITPAASANNLNEVDDAAQAKATTPAAIDEVTRPTFKPYVVFGESADTIDHYAVEIKTIESQLLQEDADTSATMSTVFIVFKDILTAQIAATAAGSVIHAAPAVMSERFAGVCVDDVIWDNANKSYFSRQATKTTFTGVYIAMTILWGLLIAAVSAFSQLANIEKLIPAFKTVLDLSPVVSGIIASVLPAVVVSVLISLVPMFLRLFERFGGAGLYSEVERSVHGRFFAFQVVNVFFASVIGSSVLSSIKQIVDSPASAVMLLATAIPASSTFFTYYILLLALSGTSGEILQIGALIVKPILLRFLGSTPRAVHGILQPPAFVYATTMASHALVAVLGVVFCVIAPVVTLLAFVYFALFYIVYVYQMRNVYSFPNQTGGRFLYNSAKHVLVGLYIAQIMMVGLFGLNKCYPQAAISAVLIGVTAWFSAQMARFNPVVGTLAVASKEESSAAGPAKRSIADIVLPGMLSNGVVETGAGEDAASTFEVPDVDALRGYLIAHPVASIIGKLRRGDKTKVWVPAGGGIDVQAVIAKDLDGSVQVVKRDAKVSEKGVIVVRDSALGEPAV